MRRTIHSMPVLLRRFRSVVAASRVRLLVTVFAVCSLVLGSLTIGFLVVPSSAAQAGCDDQPDEAYALSQQTADGSPVQVIVSHQGVARTVYTTNTSGQQVPLRATLACYSQGLTYAVDYQQQTYTATSLGAISTSSAPLGGPVPGAGLTLAPTGETAHIQGIETEAYLLSINGVPTLRLWYAKDLPVPPPDLVQAWTAGVTGQASGASDTLEKLTGRQVLRIESQQNASPSAGSGWQIVLDTLAVERTKVAPGQFTPPAGFQEHSAFVPPLFTSANSGILNTSARDAQASQQLGRSAPRLTYAGLTAQVVPGSGPVLAHPTIVPVFWGSTFVDSAHQPLVRDLESALGQLLTPRYEGALGQYGVSGGTVYPGTVFLPSDPPTAQTDDEFMPNVQGRLENLMLLGCLGIPALCGGQDGVIALFVPESLVNIEAYHDYVFHHLYNADDALLVNQLFWLQGYVPTPRYMVIPVGDGALNWPNVPNAWQQRANPSCDSLAGLCAALPDFDTATSNIGHEFAEATTDPYVDGALGWTDPPEEVADVCGELRLLPYENTDVNGLVVARYWSNQDNECMPFLSSAPTITITAPRDQATVAAPPGGGCCITLQAVTADPLDGGSDQVSWNVRSVAGLPIVPPPSSESNRGHTISYALSPATYTATASYIDPLCTKLDSQPCQTPIASTTITFTVVPAGGPSIKITQPADGASLDFTKLTTFTVSAQDGAGNPLPDSAIHWTAQLLYATPAPAPIDMGYGNSIQYTIPGGPCIEVSYRVTATATSGGRSASDSITVNTGYIC